jgi:hypothetical protein
VAVSVDARGMVDLPIHLGQLPLDAQPIGRSVGRSKIH